MASQAPGHFSQRSPQACDHVVVDHVSNGDGLLANGVVERERVQIQKDRTDRALRNWVPCPGPTRAFPASVLLDSNHSKKLCMFCLLLVTCESHKGRRCVAIHQDWRAWSCCHYQSPGAVALLPRFNHVDFTNPACLSVAMTSSKRSHFA